MFKNKRFKRRIGVYRGELVHYVTPAMAILLLESCRATVRQRTSKVISAIELTKSATGEGKVVRADQLGLRAGSFGIRVDDFDSGAWCYSHRNPWDQVIPVCQL